LQTFNTLEIQTESSCINRDDFSLNKSINTDTSLNTTIDETCHVDKTALEDLRLNLKVKESLIESINDSLILKEAEIARLKARLAVLERKNMLED
jgi:hypothetical protein